MDKHCIHYINFFPLLFIFNSEGQYLHQNLQHEHVFLFLIFDISINQNSEHENKSILK